jgi:hypothetical protein
MQTQPSRFSKLLSLPARRRWAALCLSACCLAGFLERAQAEPIYSKSRRFRIPFQFDAAELKRLGAREVHLFVSRDGGQQWALAESVSPTAAKFTFDATADGSYWFAVKTVTASGLEYPAGPPQPSLNVIVDATAPALRLQLEPADPGRVRLNWDASDPHLDISTLKLEYTEPNSQQWQSVAVRTQDRGETIWNVAHVGRVQVRGSVSDTAGNAAQANSEITLGETAAPRPERPDYSRPVANDTPATGQVAANAPAAAPIAPTPQLASAPKAEPPVANTVVANPPASVTTAPAANLPEQFPPATPNGSSRAVNSTTFRIAYEIDEVGPSGVGSVELYISEDGGKKWFHYGGDPDRTSPMEVTVPRDGDFGFAFRVVNGLGRAAIPPQPGDRPEIQITVDRTPPILRLAPPQPGQGLDLNKVVIEWSAQDQNLGERPVALYYSLTPTGPWEAIQGWQPNAGRFTWAPPATLNQPFYLRADVRDAAGNVTRAFTEQPFLVDRSVPKARITEVEALNRNSR